MTESGYQLIKIETGEVVERWPVIPPRIEIPDVLRVDGAEDGWQNQGFRVEACTWEVPEVIPNV